MWKVTGFMLTGRRAIVTGGSRGLGRAMAEALLESGAAVAIIGSGPTTAQAALDLAARPASRAACHGIRCDLSTAAGRQEGFEAACQALGGLDILVNAAGIQRRHPSEAFPIADWAAVIEVNLTAVFDLCQRAAAVMLPQGSGKIINIASLLSFSGGLTVPAYAASKGGVLQLTKALANEWAGRGINVNALAPGYMETDMNTALLADADRLQSINARIPAGVWGKPDDMKGPLLFLASSASGYVHGTCLPVDGGYLGR